MEDRDITGGLAIVEWMIERVNEFDLMNQKHISASRLPEPRHDGVLDSSKSS